VDFANPYELNKKRFQENTNHCAQASFLKSRYIAYYAEAGYKKDFWK
jgi:hypothetical protein